MKNYKSVLPEELVGLKDSGKREAIEEMFDDIAARYDKMNLVISLGQTSRWRKKALRNLSLNPGDKVLDVGCGTGWVGRYLHTKYQGLELEGMDISEKMLALARKIDNKSSYFSGDAANIPRANETYNLVTTFFTTRNFHNLSVSLAELVRVLKPGGQLVILDSFPVEKGVMSLINTFWMKKIVPFLVMPFSEPWDYRYLAKSIENHVSTSQMYSIINKLGTVDISIKNYSFGLASKIIVQK